MWGVESKAGMAQVIQQRVRARHHRCVCLLGASNCRCVGRTTRHALYTCCLHACALWPFFPAVAKCMRC
jgi:hypothetical protein